MTLNEAMAMLGVNKPCDVAKILKITQAAVCQWDKNKIPLAREYQVIKLAESNIDVFLTPEAVISEQ